MDQSPDMRASAGEATLVAPTEPTQASAEATARPAVDTATPGLSKLSHVLASPRMPFIFLGCVIFAALGYLLVTYVPAASRLGFGGPNIVLFDPVKFTNAQRAAVSLLQMNQNADLALTMTQVARHAEAVIREEAKGAIVLVRQTVVAPGDLVDITDAVLTRFGLSTNVPTVTTNPGEAASLEQLAPTDSAFSSGKLREDYLLQLGERNARAAEVQQSQDSQTKILP